MKIAYYIKKESLRGDSRIMSVLDDFGKAGVELYPVFQPGELRPGTDMLLSFGGDGTFLCAARRVAGSDVPVLGVNLGRMGFLSENRPESVVKPVLEGEFTVCERDMLQLRTEGFEIDGLWPYALNEVCIHRNGSATLGIDVRMGGTELPTYWADGIIVATSSGSTAYSLSAGGPICTPDAKVLIIAPVAPHNLNLRPLVVPLDTEVKLTLRSRDAVATLSLDNREYPIGDGKSVTVKTAPFRLGKVALEKSNFIEALESRFFWGQDVRNLNEK